MKRENLAVHPPRVPRALSLTPCAFAACLASTPSLAADLPDPEWHTAVSQQVEINGQRQRQDERHDPGVGSTATRLDLSLRETPQAMTVITRALIDDLALGSVQDLLKLAPGVTVERVETDRSYYLSRGFEISNFQIDGVGLPFATGDQLGDLDTALYERVEVLRGANGLMSFTGNPSATVNFIRKRPTDTLQARGAVTVGSWGQRRFDVDVSTPLSAEGTVRGRIVAAAEKGDSWLDRYSQDKQVVGAVVDAKLASSTVLTLGASQQKNRPQGVMWGALPLLDATGAPVSYGRSASTAADWSYWNTHDRQAFAELEHGFGNDWHARATFTRRALGSDSELLYVYGALDRDIGEGLFQWPSKYWHSERQTVLDLSLSGPFTLAGRRHELVLGVNGSRSENMLRSSDQDTGLPLDEQTMLAGTAARPPFDQGITGQADFTDRRRSGFAVVRWSVADTLSLLTGVNATRAESEGEQYGEPHSYRRTRTKPYLGAVWDLDSHHSLYASHAGIFSPQSKLDRQGQVLAPIEGSSTEAGVKGEWLGGRLNGSLSIFRVKQDNTAVAGGFENGRTWYVGENATSTGHELEVAGQPVPGWQLSAGWAQLRLKGDSDDVRPHVPRRTFRLATTVKVSAVPGLKLGGALKWQDDTHNGAVHQKAYSVADLHASYELTRQLQLGVNLRNVGNTKALTSLLWAQAYTIAPRNGSVTLQWRH